MFVDKFKDKLKNTILFENHEIKRDDLQMMTIYKGEMVRDAPTIAVIERHVQLSRGEKKALRDKIKKASGKWK